MGQEIAKPAGSPAIAGLGPAARALLEALAVLGEGRVALIDAAAVAGQNPANAVDELVAAGLVRAETAFGVHLTITSASTRDEVYRSIPGSRRRRLHARAGAGMSGHSGLRHLTLAAVSPDQGLADDLERQARQLHARAQHVDASEVWGWASTLTPDRDEAMRRQIEAALERVLAGDLDAVEEEIGRYPADARGYALLSATVHAWRGRWRDAVETLSASEDLDDRGWALLAAAAMRAGCPEDDIRDALRNLGQVGPLINVSPAFARFAIQARALLEPRSSVFVATAPEGDARDVSAPLTYALAVRGALRVLDGAFDEAARDLTEAARRLRVVSRIRGDGLLPTMLGAAHWFRGQFELADGCFESGRASAWDHNNPMKLAFASLGATGDGDLARADRVLSRANDVLRSEPWHEGVVSYVIARAVRLNADPDDSARAHETTRLRREFGAAAVAPEVSPRRLWLLYRGLIAAWEGDEAGVDFCATRLVAAVDLAWAAPAASWLRMLAAEAGGTDARSISERLTRTPTTDFPLLDACVLADAGRVRDDTALLRQAESAYQRLGEACRV
ncbi:MAG: hypothetical protein ACK5LO_02015 [Leucobacter sp.]